MSHDKELQPSGDFEPVLEPDMEPDMESVLEPALDLPMDPLAELSDQALETVCVALMRSLQCLPEDPAASAVALVCIVGSSHHADQSNREPMEVDMNANLTFAGKCLHRTRFVLVNERIPRADKNCALCGRMIENGYVRDSQTRLIYCDTQCLPGGADRATPLIHSRTRKVS
jgi:hypothetical protein